MHTICQKQIPAPASMIEHRRHCALFVWDHWAPCTAEAECACSMSACIYHSCSMSTETQGAVECTCLAKSEPSSGDSRSMCSVVIYMIALKCKQLQSRLTSQIKHSQSCWWVLALVLNSQSAANIKLEDVNRHVHASWYKSGVKRRDSSHHEMHNRLLLHRAPCFVPRRLRIYCSGLCLECTQHHNLSIA